MSTIHSRNGKAEDKSVIHWGHTAKKWSQGLNPSGLSPDRAVSTPGCCEDQDWKKYMKEIA